MNRFLPAACVSALLIGAALPAHASTFATISGEKVSWFRPGSGPARGFLHSVGNNTFNFLSAGLPTGLTGDLVLSVGETGTNAQTLSGDGITFYSQGGIGGTFNEIYNGVTQTLDGVDLIHGTTSLLSGTVSDGTLVGATVDTGDGPVSLGGELTLTVSDYLSPFITVFSPPESLDLTIALAGGNWGVTSRTVGGVPTSTLSGFSDATASGNFLGATVVEPASWAMMLTGFGIAGMAIRRRRLAELSA